MAAPQPTGGNLAAALVAQSLQRPTGLAVSAAGRRLSYAELASLSGRVALWLRLPDNVRPARVGILGARSIE